MKAPRLVRCPQCGAETPWVPENPWRPFCSDRCKQIDLGCWAAGDYVIPGPAGSEDADAPGLDVPDAGLR